MDEETKNTIIELLGPFETDPEVFRKRLAEDFANSLRDASLDETIARFERGLEKARKQVETEFGLTGKEIEQKLNQALTAIQNPTITFVTEPGEPGAEVYEINLNELEREQHRRALTEDGAEFWTDAAGKEFWRKDNGEWQLLN